MASSSVVSAVALVFIAAMAWLRTRLKYRQRMRGPLRLTRSGAVYFAVLAALLVLAWSAGPYLVGPASPVTMGRVVGFLAVYLLSIPVHRALHAGGFAAFRVAGDPPPLP